MSGVKREWGEIFAHPSICSGLSQIVKNEKLNWIFSPGDIDVSPSVQLLLHMWLIFGISSSKLPLFTPPPPGWLFVSHYAGFSLLKIHWNNLKRCGLFLLSAYLIFSFSFFIIHFTVISHFEVDKWKYFSNLRKTHCYYDHFSCFFFIIIYWPYLKFLDHVHFVRTSFNSVTAAWALGLLALDDSQALYRLVRS